MSVLAYWKLFFGWNIIVATVYGFDKFLAWWFSGVTNKNDSGGIRGHRRPRRHRYWRRISEDFLLLLLFACAPLGAWIAMEGLRHKTRKTSFRRRAILLTIVNPLWPVLYMAMKTWFNKQFDRMKIVTRSKKDNSTEGRSSWNRTKRCQGWLLGIYSNDDSTISTIQWVQYIVD